MRRALVILALLVAVPLQAHAFPEEEITGITDGPPFSFGFSDNVTSFILKDNRTMLVTYGQVLRLVDLGFYELYATQPKDLADDDIEDNDSPFNGAVYLASTDEVMITQERGHLIIYKLGSLEDDPTDVTIAEGNSLGPITVNNSETEAYIGDNTADSVHVVDLSTLTVTATIAVQIDPPQTQAFDFTDAVFVPTTSSAYFSTDKGGIVVVKAGSTTATVINIGVPTEKLTGIAKSPGDAFIYVSNNSIIEANKVDVNSTSTIVDIDLTPNTSPVDVIVTDVTNPNSTYTYVAGGKGVSVINPSNVVLTLGSKTKTGEPITMSSAAKLLVPSTDGYIYAALAGNTVGIISENPWLTIVSVVYSSGSALTLGGTVTITFQSNVDGTYELRSGGDVDASGTVLADDQGDISGSVTANTDTAVIIPYDSNANAFVEGDNEVFVFVTDASSNLGRRGTTVNVDTPPDVVTLQSTGFGNERVYITFERLTANDIKTYNLYVDPDPNAVLTKTDKAAIVAQPDSGSTVQAEASDLTNGVLYYMAVEAVDTGGNVSPQRANKLPDGSLASATPQRTVGPAGFAGEAGCSLMMTAAVNTPTHVWLVLVMLSFISLALARQLTASRGGASFSLRPRTSIARSITMSRLSLRRIPHLCLVSFVYKRWRGAWDVLFGGPVRPPKKYSRSKPASAYNNVWRQGSESRRRKSWLVKLSFVLLVVLLVAVNARSAHAQWVERAESPQWWSFEVKTGFWLPQASSMKEFFGPCCNIITRLQGGLLIHGKYGIEQGVGIMVKGGDAVGITSGQASADRFSFLTIPMETNFVFRMDYWGGKYVIPYIKAGVDYVFFRENTKGDVTKGLKWGAHGVAGLQLPLAQFSDEVSLMDAQYGINDMAFTFEAQYQWIDTFGGTGLDLSGWLFSIGLLFLF